MRLFLDDVRAVVASKSPEESRAEELATLGVQLKTRPEGIQERDGSGSTALHLAAQAGRLDIARLLIAAGADLDAQDQGGNTPLHWAVQSGARDLAAFLLAQGAAVDLADPDGHTAAFFAALRDDVESLALLRSHGADLRRTASFRGSLLHYAAMYSPGPAIRWLLDLGLPADGRSWNGETPLGWAMYRKNILAIAILLEAGTPIETPDIWGNTPLAAAILTRSAECAAALIDLGADPNGRSTENGRTPLHAAVGPANHRIDPEIVALLLDRGADPDSRLDDGTTALAWAASCGNPAVVRLLLDRGARAEPFPGAADSALHHALRAGDDTIIGMILDATLAIDSRDACGKTPLHLAAAKGKAEVAGTLLARGAAVDTRDVSGMTPLHRAAAAGYADVAAILLGAGADADARDLAGETAADLAVRYGCAMALLTLEGVARRGTEQRAGRRPTVSRSPGVHRGSAVITYLGHSGWAVDIGRQLLVFDYWNAGARTGPDASLANGRLTRSELASRQMVVFASMPFPDHFDRGIFNLAGEGTTFVYGFDPRRDGAAYDGPDHLRVNPGESSSIGDLRVTAIVSTAGGAGFLVRTDGLTVFHAGDHTNRRQDLTGPFCHEIDSAAGIAGKVDLAFLPVGGPVMAERETVAAGNRYAMEALRPSAVFTMHAGDQEESMVTSAEEARRCFPGTVVHMARMRGDRFVIPGTARN